LEEGRAVGVEVQSTKGKEGARIEFRAPVVVSDAGAWNTFTRLLPREAVPFRAELETPPDGLEAVELFLGLKDDPRKLGVQGENYWIFSSFDHDRMSDRRDELLEGRAPMAYLSFPSLKDPRARQHTAEILAPFSYRSLEAYRKESWRCRGTDYESAKKRVTDALLDLVDKQHPGFRDLVAYAELATPLTFEHFTAAPSGTIYGYPGTPDKFRKAWLAPRTPIRNLYLTGADAAMLGIMGAVMGGLATASTLLGSSGYIEIMRAASSPQTKARVAAAR
jgi:all-trans-retinol 13,14-reductase